MEQPKAYNFKDYEPKWRDFWEKEGIYKFKYNPKKPTYSVDTPPPTVSGNMHLGHAFSYSQQDFIVRFQRMIGKNVYYPFGTDDNGLPTERLVEKLKNVKSTSMERSEFVELCNKTIKEIKPSFIQDWKDIGMSCDFSTTYSTIDSHCIKTSQKSFIDLFKKGLVYQQEAPSMFCVNCQTAIAQAELEDKELDSTFNDIYFDLEDGSKITIATTRPELIPACVCIYVHPNDIRYKHLINKIAVVPLTKHKVPIFADESVDMKKGSGIMMICSYGDKYDVEAINKRGLTPRVCISKNGTLNDFAGKYKGLKIKEARKAILEDLEKEGRLIAKKPIKHIVNVHDKCGTEIEFLSSKQWFIRILENKKLFLDAAEKIRWYPETMKLRYLNWVEGLQWDWGISRQRHFGVPFPLWICKKCHKILIADESQLPVDPLKDKPSKKCDCGSDEFEIEKDVMDTWATSSTTPEIISNWVEDKNYGVDFKEIFPTSLRPQAHDIIRTWAFYTIVKSIYHFNQVPWENIVISGHVLDPKGESMHKSKGNAIEPKSVLDKYPADALRFWAASSKLGEDLRYLEKDLVTGQKTILKLLNATNFCFLTLKDYVHDEKVNLEETDKLFLSKLNDVIIKATKAFEEYEYSKAKAEIEGFFWRDFCDNYLEIIKDRLYNPDKRGNDAKKSAQYTLYKTLLAVIKMFAPIMPFVTEEIYQNYFKKYENEKSIHLTLWPRPDELKENLKIWEDMKNLIAMVRAKKSEKQKSLKDPVKLLVIDSTFENYYEDIKAVTKAEEIEFGEFSIEL